jgi:dolichol-phosphate mannosyltransferase
MSSPLISIVVPTLREAGNLPTLIDRIDKALSGRSYEVIVVDDDSRDGTDRACAELALRFPVRLIVRTNPIDGLGGAVMLGLGEARGSTLVVMDADLQHPPERLPALVDAVESGRTEFAIGSRHVAGAGVDEHWPWHRRLTSRLASFLARPFAHGVQDVMSGFFATRRDVIERARHVAPRGFKIALELLCKTRTTSVEEIPIRFGVRAAGASKLTTREKFRYLEHLSRLYDFTFPRVAPAMKFLVVCVVGGAAMLTSAWLMREAGVSSAWAGTSYLASIATTAMFHARYVRAHRPHLVRPTPWRDFLMSALAELAIAISAGFYVHQRVDVPAFVELTLIPFTLATVVRYILRKELLLDIRGLRFISR